MQNEHAQTGGRTSWRSWLPRFSLRELLLATTFVAIGCYALRWASPWWSIVLFYTNVITIAGGLLVAINWPGERRAFWLAFAVCGLAHWLLAFHPGIPPHYPGAFGTHWFSAWTYHGVRPWLTVKPESVSLRKVLETRGRVEEGDGELHEGPYSPPLRRTLNAGEDGKFRAWGAGPFYILEEDFCNVALGLWTLLFGYIGGLISVILYRCRGPADELRTMYRTELPDNVSRGLQGPEIPPG
ncbi:MAG: hypothetical protein MUF06_05030 [Pirellulaceae bacterium]|jgi:hypothetical protein|nr:hypothetical protein [Pirellulaceae bacterium]